MKYKVGDEVRIKSLEWYSKNRNPATGLVATDPVFNKGMATYCGRVARIDLVEYNCYVINLDLGLYYWTDDMFEDEPILHQGNDFEPVIINRAIFKTPVSSVKRKPFIKLRARGNVKY